uniref:CAAX prenyl protease 2/Lysostaphin resistance protein A-like domain-containing protein n=1 Tax=Arundo donax TaxID=35708 RepID=A0A0A9DP92_ARUDO
MKFVSMQFLSSNLVDYHAGVALGFSYAQTRNLLTPITIHAFWNSGVILLLTFLQLQGYDIKELLGAS